MFSVLLKIKISILATLTLLFVHAFNLTESKIFLFGKDLHQKTFSGLGRTLCTVQINERNLWEEWIGALTTSTYLKCQKWHSAPFINSLLNKKNLEGSKFKAFADNKINVTEKIEICFGKSRKSCGKRRKCWLAAFSPFHTMFSKAFLNRVVKSQDCVVQS